MRKYKARSLGVALFLASSLVVSTALAASPTGQSSSLELRDGTSGALPPWFDAKPSTGVGMRGLRTLRSDLGAGTHGMWSASTGVPTRLWGFSVPAPRDAEGVRKLARETLERHLELLAPGAAPQDFVLGSDDTSREAGGLRTVGFVQLWHGLPVIGSDVVFSFKNDKLFGLGSTAQPDIVATMPAAVIDRDIAISSALAWVTEDATSVEAGAVDGPFVLPYDDHGSRAYAVVLRVRVEAQHPAGSFDVFVDAGTGAPLARKQLLMFETAEIDLEAWERSPSFGPRNAYPGDGVPIDFEGSNIVGASTTDGTFTFNGDTVAGTFSLDGDLVSVTNAQGEDITLDFEAVPGDTILWSEDDETRDAQLNAYVHAAIVNAYAKTFAPDLDFLSDPVHVSVNEDDVCNAYSDGTKVHFYASGSGCENTARIGDVIYHEYGHSIHCHTYKKQYPNEQCIPDGALSEGIADYTAVTITGDHGMGRGFFYDENPLRDLDPDIERVWPADVVGEAHYDGEIIGGTLWDLRKGLIEELGEEEGIATSDHLFHYALEHAISIPTMYPQMLLVDDDDGDLSNGTPHECQIDAAFSRHGLRPVETTIDIPSIAPPSQDGAEISVAIVGLTASCGESLSSGFMSYHDLNEPTQSGTVTMTIDGDGIAHGRVPTKTADHVIAFDVNLDSAVGSFHFPDNAADPAYQLYVGEVTPIYCTDFESDPFAAGWTHELMSGVDELGADDWMWGPPGGDGQNGDPTDAFSGGNVVGNDLSPPGENNWDGHYKPDRHTALVSPSIDASGYDKIRLQYRRWLNVEDGHFDHATILANYRPVWENADSDRGDQSNVHHTDKEWRFQDVDLTPSLASETLVQVRFEMESDGGLELGGWTIDDFCLVGVKTTCPGGTCPPDPTPQPQPQPQPSQPTAAPEGNDDQAAPSPSGGCDCTVRGDARPTSPIALVGLGAAALVALRRRGRR